MSGDDRPLETGWLPDTPTDDNVLWGFLGNQIAYNALVASVKGGRTDDVEGMSLADSTTPIPYLNQAILTRPLFDADDPRVGAASAFFAESPPATLLSVWPTPDLSRKGWQLVGHPAFVVRAAGPHPVAAHEGVTLTHVTGAEDLATFERVAVEGYPIDEAIGFPPGAVFPPGLIGSGATLRIGAVDGVPSAIGVGFVHSGVSNLCLGATMPAARRRGVWSELVWARVDDAPDLPAVAFTSDYSRPGFVRMGFAPVLRFTLWAR